MANNMMGLMNGFFRGNTPAPQLTPMVPTMGTQLRGMFGGGARPPVGAPIPDMGSAIGGMLGRSPAPGGAAAGGFGNPSLAGRVAGMLGGARPAPRGNGWGGFA